MNPFERIEEERKILNQSLESVKDKAGTFISIEEHQKTMLNFLNLLEHDLETAEYQYQVESIDAKVETLSDIMVSLRELEEDLYVFQPVMLNDDNLSMIDMKSLVDTLSAMRESGRIKKDVLFLAPNINVLKAKLVKNEPAEDTEEEE
jgi:hypothetical protein